MKIPLLTRNGHIEIPKITETMNLGNLRNIVSTRGGVWKIPATPYSVRHIHQLLDAPQYEIADTTLLRELWDDGKPGILLHRKPDQLNQPHTPRFPMWPHQSDAYRFVISRHAALLYMGMGTGKTKVTIDVCETRRCERVLVICPKTLVTENVWENEFQKHGRTIIAIGLKKGSVDKRVSKMRQYHARALGTGEALAIIINFETLISTTMKKALSEIPFDTIIVDESHRIKSAGGKQSRAIAQIGQGIRFRLALTGTPLGNDCLDAYGQFRFLDSGIFGLSFARFRAQYATMRPLGNTGVSIVNGYINVDDFRRKFYHITFRVDRDVLQLREPVTVNRYCDICADARKTYKTLDKELTVERKEGSITAMNALAKMLRLHQIGCGFAKLDDSDDLIRIDDSKLKLLIDVVTDIDTDEPFVVFCHFSEDARVVVDALKNAGIATSQLTGSKHELSAWQAGETQALVANIQAGSVGVDFTRAAICIYYSLNFRKLDYDQSLARVHRPGQKAQVTYVNLIARGTIDEKVFEGYARKADVIKEALRELK